MHALSQDMCVETLPMPIIAPIAVHRQFAWLSSLMPYSGVYIAYLVLHYPNYNSFCYWLDWKIVDTKLRANRETYP